MKTFLQAWAEMEAKGYQYGDDALELVRFGWELREAADRAERGFLPQLADELDKQAHQDPRIQSESQRVLRGIAASIRRVADIRKGTDDEP